MIHNNLNLRHLEAFVAIATAGNFTRASQSLNISQPTLTVQIKQLEETIGVRLLDRNTRNVKLTRIGQQLAPVIERVLRDIETVVHHAHDMALGIRGTVTVAALPSVCSTILPRIIALFRAEQPGISVALKDAPAQRVLAMVKNGEADFGIGSFSDADAGIQITPLFTDHLKVVLPRSSPLASKRAIQLKQLVNFPLILMDRQSSVRLLVDSAFARIGSYPTPAYEPTYMSSAVGMVKAGLGIAFLPSSTLEMSELSGLVARRIDNPGLTRRIVAIQRSESASTPPAASFLKVLAAGCKNIGDL
jgi:DNA-binding transcriptional LysR family regulator